MVGGGNDINENEVNENEVRGMGNENEVNQNEVGDMGNENEVNENEVGGMGNENEGEAVGNEINQNGGELVENKINENEGEAVGNKMNENEVGGMGNENGEEAVGHGNGDVMVGGDAKNENGGGGVGDFYEPSFGYSLIPLADLVEQENLPWLEPRNDDYDDDDDDYERRFYIKPGVPLFYNNYEEFQEAKEYMNLVHNSNYEDVNDENNEDEGGAGVEDIAGDENDADEDIGDEDEVGVEVEDIGGDENDVGGEEPGQPDQQEAPRTPPIEEQISLKRISNSDDDADDDVLGGFGYSGVGSTSG
jgi:hypothetical protein